MTPEQTESMNQAVEDFSVRALSKYPKGQAEHKGNLWDARNLVECADEEIVDQMFYLHALRKKRSAIASKLFRLSVDMRSENPPNMNQVAGVVHSLAMDIQRL